MDRERLKEVHQTDLTESRINEDFLDWLKTKGPTWLLLILVFVCVYLGVVRFKQHKTDVRSKAWTSFQDARLPGSYEEVAADYGDVDQLGKLARMRAAGELMRSVQMGLTLGSDPNPAPDPTTPSAPPPEATRDPLPEDERTRYLDRADGLYQAIVDEDDGSSTLTLLIVNAMNGKAAVAEARGEAEDARRWYLAAAERAEESFPGLAAQAQTRAETASEYLSSSAFLTPAEIQAALPAETPRVTFDIEESLRDLLLPEEDAETEAEN